MKTYLPLFAFVVFALVACTKSESSLVTDNAGANLQSAGQMENISEGTLIGTIMPFGEETTVFAYSQEYQSEPVYLSKDGTFSLNLPPGYFDLEIHYISLATGQPAVMTHQKHIVVENEVTDAGVIEVE